MPFPQNPRAVVTGAGSGLGRAFALDLARRSARLVLSDIDLAAAEDTARQCGQATAVRCDVARIEDVEALAATADRVLGGVDLVVNNAGVAVAGPMGEVSLEDWRWIMGVNLWGVIHGCHVFAPRMKKQRSGHLLNVASAAGLLSPPLMGPYNVTKAAVVSLSETLRGELQPDGVGVSVLCPTFFPTNIHKSARGANAHQYVDGIDKLMRRSRLSADDVARIALDKARAGQLYILPHEDGRWMWRAKRANPTSFHTTGPKIMLRALKYLDRL